MKWKKILSEEMLTLKEDIKDILKNKNKIIIFIILLPLTFIFLIENFFVYFFSLFFYFNLFFLKLIKYKIMKKNTKKIIYVNRFLHLKNNFLIIAKNCFLEYPKSRAFFNFYFILNKISKTINNKNWNEKTNYKELIKIIINRYFLIIITGLPFILLFCNCWLVNKIFLIWKIKKIEKASFLDFFYILIININRDLMPVFKIYIKKFKIKFNFNKIIFNPPKKITQEILNLAKNKNLNKDITNIKKNSIIFFARNIESKENNIIKWSNRHLETLIFLNEEEVISTNETSKEFLCNKLENLKINNIYYGGCSYKNGNCYITKPILSKIEYKNLLKDSINYKIKNIDFDKANYNQILSIICNLQSGYIEAKYINKENKIEFYYKENKNNMIDIIRKNKNLMKSSTYESIENANNFFEEVKKFEEEIELKGKILLTHESLSYNLINSNESIFQLLKLK